MSNCDANDCKDYIPDCKIEIDDKYLKERAMLLNTFLFTVIEGIYHYNYQLLSFPVSVTITSDCAFDIAFRQANNLHLEMGDLDHNGHIFDSYSGCYVYFDIDCEGNCLVNYATDFNGNSNCDDIEVVGETCTTDPTLENEPGYYYYIECPPSDGEEYDICDLFEVIPNPAYVISDPGGVAPCICQQQMLPNGDPATAQDSDGDGVCDILDQCAPAEDSDGNQITESWMADYVPFDDLEDSDGDGIPDCLDGCDGDLSPFIKEGYAAPTGAGDVCDDGNPCTYDDVVTEECECRGVYIDTDDDGVYDCEDCGIGPKLDAAGNPELDEDDNPIYICLPCNGDALSVVVDAVGNLTDPGADDARTLIGCDVCPGIPDGDPADQDDFPMDYNNNGLPDCIDPPFKPICPDDYKISEDGLGLILIFYTDDLSEEDYPEPISFQGLTDVSYDVVSREYLTVGFGRETVGQVDIDGDGEFEDQAITEVYYSIEYLQFDEDDFIDVNVIYSDHQSCNIGGGDVVPLPCPSTINIQWGVILFDQSPLGNVNIEDLFGTFTLSSGGNSVDIITTNGSDFDVNEDEFRLDVGTDLLSDFTDGFDGTITLPSGQVCVFNNGDPESCNFVNSDGASIPVNSGTPCDDLDDCTFNDIYVKDAGNNCVCIGEEKPDFDEDGLCDAIDPCPEEPNELDANGEPIFDSCPCPPLELNLDLETNPELVEGNDFYLHVVNDMSEYKNITITIDDGQNEVVTQTLGAVSPIIVSNLAGGFVYTVTITAKCENSDPESLTYEIDAPFGDAPILCGKALEPIDVSHYSLLPSLAAGEEFKASDFDVNVKQSSGAYGKYSGKGYISVPFFNLARLNVVFKDITINTDRQMIDGFLEIKGYGLAVLGDEISNAINSNLDGIIGVLQDLSDVLTTLIDVLEDTEELINTTGHLVDPLIVKCVEDNTDILEILKAQAEMEPSLPDDELAAIKEQIENVSADLKDCLDQYNAQLTAILGDILTFIPNAIGFMNADCMENAENISDAYLPIKNTSKIAFDERITEILEQFINCLDCEIPADLNNENSFTKTITVNQSEVESNADFDEVLLYFDKQSKFDLCVAIPKVKIYFDNNEMTLGQVKVMLKLFTEFGADLSSIIGVDLKEGVLTHEEIFNKYQIEIERSFISVLVNFTY